jgi:hypothetical protein
VRRRAWQPHRLKLLRLENLLAGSVPRTEGQSVENTLSICIEIHPLRSGGKPRLQPFLSFLTLLTTLKMRGLLYLVAGLATANAAAVHVRDPIPQPAPKSAYVASPPQPVGKAQPYVLSHLSCDNKLIVSLELCQRDHLEESTQLILTRSPMLPRNLSTVFRHRLKHHAAAP